MLAWGGDCQSGGACFKRPPPPPSLPSPGGSGARMRRCPPASARERRDLLPACARTRPIARAHRRRLFKRLTVIFVVGSGCGDGDLVNQHRWRLCKRLTVIFAVSKRLTVNFVVGIGMWRRRTCQPGRLADSTRNALHRKS